ncbi:MAG: DUF2029 domain-containing protein [Xanthomonadales bacterium]|nr:DUF2029 domain-containing protein [Xanthomonadales bacterium]
MDGQLLDGVLLPAIYRPSWPISVNRRNAWTPQRSSRRLVATPAGVDNSLSAFPGSGLNQVIEKCHLWQIAILGALAGGIAALLLGFSPDWDLFNYHLYNPHALIQGRLTTDIAPAQIQGFLNPLFHIPFYYIFVHFGPAALVFFAGALQGLQWVLLGLLLMRILPSQQIPQWMAWTVATFGMFGPIFIYELGGTQGDTIVSALVLASLLLILPGQQDSGNHDAHARAWLAGLLGGLAVALKLTMALYVIGLFVALLVCRPFKAPLASAWRFGAACAGGFLLGGIAWFGWLWLNFHNPLFPYFNQLFESDWASTVSFRDRRFLPGNALEWMVYPLAWLLEDYKVWEFRFRDVRPLLLYPLMFLVPLLAWRKTGREAPALRMLLVFLAFSYLLWLPLFSIYRYLSVLEMLAPLALFTVIAWLGASRRTAMGGLALLIASQLMVGYKRADVIPDLNINQATALQDLPSNSMLIVSGYEPLSFAALWLSDDIPMIRIRSNFMRPDRGLLDPEIGGDRLSRLALKRISGHDGPLFLLQSPSEGAKPFLEADLRLMGLTPEAAMQCMPVFTHTRLQQQVPLELCPLNDPAPVFPGD